MMTVNDKERGRVDGERDKGPTQGRQRIIAYFSPYIPSCLELMG